MRSIQLFLFVLFLVCVNIMPAQDPGGIILGRVTDSPGSTLPNANVKITNVDTGLTVTTTTNDGGNYRAPYLNPGGYNVEVEAAGFSKLLSRDVKVRTTGSMTFDIEMKVGQVSE